MPPEDRIRLQHMIDAAAAGMGFVKGRQRADLDEDRMLSFALIRAIEINGEAARHVCAATKASIDTVGAVGGDHRHAPSCGPCVVHIDHETVWNTVQAELPRLVATLQRALVEH
jgi:uncharacterized protein with HEPN domain